MNNLKSDPHATERVRDLLALHGFPFQEVEIVIHDGPLPLPEMPLLLSEPYLRVDSDGRDPYEGDPSRIVGGNYAAYFRVVPPKKVRNDVEFEISVPAELTKLVLRGHADPEDVLGQIRDSGALIERISVDRISSTLERLRSPNQTVIVQALED